MSRKVVVTGGRRYANKARVYECLDHLLKVKPFDMLIEGGATGADTLAREWAKERCFPCLTCEADWDFFGNAAGSIRNGHMLKTYQPILVLAFPGGPGTKDCVTRAVAMKITVVFEKDITTQWRF